MVISCAISIVLCAMVVGGMFALFLLDAGLLALLALTLGAVAWRFASRALRRADWRRDRDSSRAPSLRRGGPGHGRTRYGVSSPAPSPRPFQGSTIHGASFTATGAGA